MTDARTDLKPLRQLAQRFANLSMYDHSIGRELTVEERQDLSQRVYDLIERVEKLEGEPPEAASWYAPFTPEQVAELHRWQITPWVHPFTCGNNEHVGGVSLTPTAEGWICPVSMCGFTQDWCHSFMADGSLPTKSPLEAAMERAPVELEG